MLAGPFATMILGDLGAEVITIERPGVGDETRSTHQSIQYHDGADIFKILLKKIFLKV